jgi:hypothetical protein
MADTKKVVGLVGLYDDPAALVRAATRFRDAGYRTWDCHTPYPVHGLDRAMGLRGSPLALYALLAGFVGVAAALGMQGWMNAVDYPINVGGKPFFSWPAFMPLTFELFVLFTALAATALGCVYCRLFRWHSPLHDSNIMAEITSHRFAVVLDAADDRFDPEEARVLFEETGSTDVRPLVEFVPQEEAPS